jgi:hypothetical protein
MSYQVIIRQESSYYDSNYLKFWKRKNDLDSENIMVGRKDK